MALHRFLGILVVLTCLATPHGAACAEAVDFGAAFLDRLVQWVDLLTETLRDHDAEIAKAEDIKREAERYLLKREVRSNAELFRTFYQAKTNAERAIRNHRSARRHVRSRIRRVQAVHSHLSTQSISAEKGVTLDFRGPIRIEREGRTVIAPEGADMPFVIEPGDLLEVGENGKLTFLHPEVGAELSIQQNTRALYEKVVSGKSPSLKLIEGKVRFEINRRYTSLMQKVAPPVRAVLKRLKGRPRFAITTAGPVVGVRATAFSFEYDPNGRAVVSVWEGTVDVTPWEGADDIGLAAPSRIVIGPGETIEGPVELTPIEIERILADEPE